MDSDVGLGRHLLDVDALSVQGINFLLKSAEGMLSVMDRSVKKVPALRGRSVVILFYEVSTRTRLSFELAAKMLSADVVYVWSQTSSVKKGESLRSTLRTLASTEVDVCVLRHPQAGAAYCAARFLSSPPSMSTSLINAGDGQHAHPTQALLDLLTIRRHIGEFMDRKVAILGDVYHSRVARSLIIALLKMDAKPTIFSHPALMPREWTTGSGPSGLFTGLTVAKSTVEAVEDADVVVGLRFHHERLERGQNQLDAREYADFCRITDNLLVHAKPECFVMHPGPVVEDIDLSSSLARSYRSTVEEQVRNGLAIRMATLYAYGAGDGNV